MVGYSEVLQTIGAMVIFSLILLSATSLIQRNTYMQISGELEQEVIAVAQDIIEEGRTKEFDENSMGAAPPANIPGDFTGFAAFGPDISADDDIDDDENNDGKVVRSEFDDFDDYHGWQDSIQTEHGTFVVNAEVYYADPTTYDITTGSRTTFKKMIVKIRNKFLYKGHRSNPIVYKLEFLRNYYAD